MKIVKNIRGDGYVFPCVIILVICMILSVFIFFASTASWIRITKENTETVMDSYIIKNSITIFNSIKQGNDYTEVLDAAVYIDDLCKYCTLVSKGNYLYAYDSKGKVQYQISKPYFTFQKENTLKIQVHYTLYVPIWFNGKAVGSAVIPVTINSALSEKF